MMKRFLLLAILATAAPARAQQPATAARVEALLARMTLEEKVGQMTQVNIGVVATDSQPSPRDSIRLDRAKLREAIVTRGVGSILNTGEGAIPVAAWQSLIRQIQDVATKETRLHIPILYGVDAMHGHNYVSEGTVYPHNIALAATFNPVLVEQLGEVTASEVAATGVHWNFAPVLDVGRQHQWPRFYETWGEDAWLAALLGAANVRGMQRTGEVGATAKHYLGYNFSRSGRDRTPADVSVRYVREHALPPFRAAVREGIRSVMVNSGEIDGEPVHASRYWLTDVLRKELGFKGLVVTDWEDINFLHTRHRVAPTLKDAVRLAVDAGVDMSMTPLDYRFADDLIKLVRDNVVPMKRIDESVRRILTMKAELGLLDNPYPDPTLTARVGSSLSRALARQAAREAITLLKNDRRAPVLPLARTQRVLLTGPTAASLSALLGGWSYTWQGVDLRYYPKGIPTLADAIRRRAPGMQLVPADSLDAAVRAARQSDVAIVALGEEGYAEWVGDVVDMQLPPAQRSLASAIAATGTPTVLVLLEGRPRYITSLADSARAIVLGYWPGIEGAEAMAEVLFGEVNPSGKLPFTYAKAPYGIDLYDHKYTEELTGWGRDSAAIAPLYEFGHGLSYTTFRYGPPTLARPAITARDQQAVQVTVTNTGDRPGDESVLLFVRQLYGSLTPAVRRLRGVERVTLAPGQSRAVTFTLGADELSIVGRDGRNALEPGEYEVQVGGGKASFRVLAGQDE